MWDKVVLLYVGPSPLTGTVLKIALSSTSSFFFFLKYQGEGMQKICKSKVCALAEKNFGLRPYLSISKLENILISQVDEEGVHT